MSLVVLRSWSDGQPPRVLKIAPPDSDEKNEIVVPDHNGRFVTTEVPKNNLKPVNRNKNISTNSTNITKSTYSTNISTNNGTNSTNSPGPAFSISPFSSASSSPSPNYIEAKNLRRSNSNSPASLEIRRIEKNQPLSRESSVGIDSPPTSPVCGSRYKSLGPELAATIPRRLIICNSWIRDEEDENLSQSYNEKKKEMSKSTPSLNNLRFEDEDDEEEAIVKKNKVIKSSLKRTSRPLSYIDSFYSSNFTESKLNNSPPASIVSVLKKNSDIYENSSAENNSNNNVQNQVKHVSEELKTPEFAKNKVSFELNLQPKRKQKTVLRSASAEFRYPQISTSTQLSIKEYPILNNKLTKYTSQELKIEPIGFTNTNIKNLENEISNDSTDNCLPEKLKPQIKPRKLFDLRKTEPENEKSEKVSSVQNDEIAGESISLSLDLSKNQNKEDISSNMSSNSNSYSSLDNFYVHHNSCNMNYNKNNIFPSKLSTIESSSNKNFSFKQNYPNKTKEPIECINPYVVVPTRDKSNEDFERRSFCESILNEILIQVPQNLPPPNTPPPVPNHDGIIIFDEEEEDEFQDELNSDLIDSDSENSIGVSERENSVDYISIFHNVTVGTQPKVVKLKAEPLTHTIGIDIGSSKIKFCFKDPDDHSLLHNSSKSSLISYDGHVGGIEAISYSLLTKNKLINNWKGNQGFTFDYDDEDKSFSYLSLIFKKLKHELNIQSESFGKERVQWNLSIHSGMDKKLLREAAFNSGLVKLGDELRLVNDSTASAVSAYEFLKESNLKWGKSFMSVNIGSTFIHTSGYELQNSKIFMTQRSESQTYSSSETHFIELLSRVFGSEFLLRFETRFQPAWAQILSRFHEMKKSFHASKSECYLFLPISFYLEFYTSTGINLEECIDDNKEEGVSWNLNGALHFDSHLVKEWTEPSVDFIKSKLKMRSYDTIVLSGGEANEIVAQKLRNGLPNTNIYIIKDPEMSVANGLLNLEKSNIVIKAPFSLGVGVMTLFDELIHPKEKCVQRQGKKWCSDVWDCLIKKGTEMRVGGVVVKRTYVGAQPGQNVLILPIFKSEEEEPKLVTSSSVEKCCELRFEMSGEKGWREVQLTIKSFESELLIVAAGNDGDVSHVIIDF